MAPHRFLGGPRASRPLALTLGAAIVTDGLVPAQAPPAGRRYPTGAHPGTATRAQVAPPPDFRRPTTLIR